MKRSHFVSLAAATVLTPTAAQTQTLTRVRFGVAPFESYALAYFAKEQGFFTRNGLDVDLQVVPGSSGGTAGALVAGAIDLGVVSLGPLANAHLRNIPLKILAPGGIALKAAPTTEMVVANNSPYHSAKDLNGRTIGTVVLRDLQHVAVLKWLDTNGGDSKTVKIVEMPIADAGPALAAGRIDAYPMPEPLLSASEDNKQRTLGGIFAAIAPRLMLSMHVGMQDWLDKNAPAARRTIVALRQAAQWANANPASVATILEAITKIDAATMARMRHVAYATSLELDTVAPQVTTLAQYGFIPTSFPVADLVWTGARNV